MTPAATQASSTTAQLASPVFRQLRLLPRRRLLQGRPFRRQRRLNANRPEAIASGLFCLVEMGGVEPPSRTICSSYATCVAVHFRAPCVAERRATHAVSQIALDVRAPAN